MLTSKQGARQRQQRQRLSQTERVLQVSAPLAAAQLVPPPLQHPGQDLSRCSPGGILQSMPFPLQTNGMQLLEQCPRGRARALESPTTKLCMPSPDHRC